MVSFRGYGFIIVFFDYFLGLYLLSKFSPAIFETESQQYLVIIAFHIVITIFNFLLAKFLNRNQIRHTFFDMRLETFVLVISVILAFIIAMMGRGIIY